MAGDDSIAVADDPDRPGRARLALSGRVTVADAGRLHRAALGALARGGDVTVSLAGAEYLDAAAVQVLMCLGRDLKARGHRCGVTGVAGPLAEALRLGGLGGG